MHRKSWIIHYLSHSSLLSCKSHLFMIIASLYRKLKSFLWYARKFTLHFSFLLFFFLLIPSHLSFTKFIISIMSTKIEIFSYREKIIGSFCIYRKVCIKCISLIEKPRIKEKLIIHSCKFYSFLFVSESDHTFIVEVSTCSLCCRFYSAFLSRSYRI